MQKSIKLIFTGIFLGAVAAGFFAFYVRATGFNAEINYQGKLTNSSGIAVADGTHCMQFKMFNVASGGASLWTETWDGSEGTDPSKVTTTNGLFSIMLGSHETLSAFDFNTDSLYLEVAVDAECTGSYETLSPRKRLGAVPAAFEAKQLGGATWASPGAIGTTTPATGSFTAFSATSFRLGTAATASYVLTADTSGNGTWQAPGTSLNGTGLVRMSGTSVSYDNSSYALATGSSSFAIAGTITSGIWQAASISDSYISSAATWNAKQAALNGTGLVRMSGTTVSYDNSSYALATGSSSFAIVGTITSGTWNGAAIGTQYGGTGQNWSAVATGSIPFFSGTGIMGTTTSMFWDNTNSRLGIGTVEPAKQLEIKSTGTGAMQITGVGASTVLQTGTEFDIVYNRTTGAPVMDFQAIPLDTTSAAYYRFGLSSGSTGANILGIFAPNSSSYTHLIGTNAVTFNENSADIDFRVESDNSANALFVQGSDGNVGIGTATPTASFQVGTGTSLLTGETAKFWGPSLIDNNFGNVNIFSTDAMAADKGGSIGLGGFGAANAYVFGKIEGRKEGSGSDYLGYLSFLTTNVPGGTVAEKMRITAAGNVGIGGASSYASSAIANALEVRSASETAPTVFIGSYSSGLTANTVKGTLALGFIYSNNTQYPLARINGVLHTGGTSADGSMTFLTRRSQVMTEAMRILASGYVGIGTATPSSFLTLSKTQSGLTTLGNARVIQLNNTNAAANELQEIGFGWQATSGNFSQPVVIGHKVTDATSQTKGSFYIATRDVTTDTFPTERLTVTSAGDVGIGTATPTARLDIVATPSYPLSIKPTGTTGERGVVKGISIFAQSTESDTVTETTRLTSAWDKLGGVYEHNSFSIAQSNGVGFDNIFNIWNGNVGIGTLTPSALFSVGISSEFTVDTNGSINTSGDIGIGGVATIPSMTGDVDIQGTVTANSYNYHSPFFTGDALSQLKKWGNEEGTTVNGWGPADHASFGGAVATIKENYYKPKNALEGKGASEIKGSDFDISQFAREKVVTKKNSKGKNVKSKVIVDKSTGQEYADEKSYIAANFNIEQRNVPGLSLIKQTAIMARAIQQLAEQVEVLGLDGAVGSGNVSGVSHDKTFMAVVKNGLAGFGITIENGIASLNQVIVNQVNIRRMQMVDQATGEDYCTWIENGEWKKAKGDCVAVAPQTEFALLSSSSSESSSESSSSVASAVTPSASVFVSLSSESSESSSYAESSSVSSDSSSESSLAPAAPEILDISSVSAITESNPTNLPANVNCIMSDGSVKDIPVAWDSGSPAYDANTPGTYIFTGTLEISDLVTNTNNVSAVANVVVAQQIQEAPSVQDAVDTVSNAVQDAASGLLNGFWNFIKWIFSFGTKKIATSSLLDSADIKAVANGLLKPIESLFSR